MGSIRFRKSRAIGGGLRMSVSKTGLGLSLGGGGFRTSIHTSGRRTTSIGIPGTGLGYVSSSGGTSHARSRQTQVPPASAASVLPKAGIFSGKAEKRYYEGVHAYLRGEHAKAIGALDEALAVDPSIPSAHIVAAVCAMKLDDDPTRTISHLEAVVDSDQELPDRYQAKYLPDNLISLSLGVKVTETISGPAPFSSVGAALMLAELYQEASRLEEAIGLIQQLHEANPSDPVIALSLADLLYADLDLEGVVEATSRAENTDDIGAASIHLRAASLYSLGHHTGAFEAFRDALAKTAKRDPELLRVIRYDRALAYTSAGQPAKAKADFERIYAQDPNYRDVRERLTAVASPP